MRTVSQYKWSFVIVFVLVAVYNLSAQAIIIGDKYIQNNTETSYTFETDIEYSSVNFYLVFGGNMSNEQYDSSGNVIGFTVHWDNQEGPEVPVEVATIELILTSVTGESYFIEKYISFLPPPAEVFPDPLDSDQNYVKTMQFNSPEQIGSENEANTISNITYIDGIGRPLQQIAIKAGGQSQDIVTPITYDVYGRQNKTYLPYAVHPNNAGSIRTTAIQESHTFYNTPKYENTLNPFSESALELSPLGRVLEQGAPGNTWALQEKIHPSENIHNHSIKFKYGANTHNVASPTDPLKDNVRLYRVSFVNNAPQLSTGAYHGNSQLYKTITYDENWTYGKNHTTEEFKNKQGQVVLKRTYADVKNPDGTVSIAEPHDTYYVYDIYGNLSYVLPPKVDTSNGVSTTELSELCYQYKYDSRNRLIEKKIPGKEWECIVYNALDQPIMTQDANLKAANKWLFTVYDVFGRVAYTGVDENNPSKRIGIQTAADAVAQQYVSKLENPVNYVGTNVYYNKVAYPTSFDKVYTINYYDNYTFDHVTLPTGNIFGQPITNNVKGLATGSKVRVLETNDWITTVTLYDERSRPIYIHSKNEYLGTVDIVEMLLDFVGNPIKTKTTHTKNGTSIVTIDNFTYDHVNRLVSQTQCIGDETMGDNCPIDSGGNITANLPITSGTITTAKVASSSITVTNAILAPGAHLQISGSSATQEQLIVSNTYDELGQLERKKVGGVLDVNLPPTDQPGLQTVDYKYNVRGWLKQINNPASLGTDLFAFDINYNTADHGGTKLYNGNIAETEWKTANDNTLRWYRYDYDALNR